MSGPAKALVPAGRSTCSPAVQAIADLSFRVLFSVIFVTAGIGHLVRPEVFVGRLVEAPLAFLATSFATPGVLVVTSGVALLAGGVGLLLGYRARASALVLIAVLVPITITVDLGHMNALGPLFKNVALLGGLIHFAARGPGAFALDRAVGRIHESDG